MKIIISVKKISQLLNVILVKISINLFIYFVIFRVNNFISLCTKYLSSIRNKWASLVPYHNHQAIIPIQNLPSKRNSNPESEDCLNMMKNSIPVLILVDHKFTLPLISTPADLKWSLINPFKLVILSLTKPPLN